MKEKPKGARCIKCQHCNEYELWINRKEKMMDKEEYNLDKYYHKECYPLFLDEEKGRQEELKVRKQLLEFITELHETTLFPKNFWYMIEDLRNGTSRMHNVIKNQNGMKKGFSYEVILRAYEMSKKKCLYVKRTKNFKSITSEMLYCLRIVEDNLYEAQKKVVQEKRSAKIVELKHQRLLEEGNARKGQYKRKGYDHDISDLFE
jgi:hypothetical protein